LTTKKATQEILHCHQPESNQKHDKALTAFQAPNWHMQRASEICALRFVNDLTLNLPRKKLAQKGILRLNALAGLF